MRRIGVCGESFAWVDVTGRAFGHVGVEGREEGLVRSETLWEGRLAICFVRRLLMGTRSGQGVIFHPQQSLR